MLVIFSVSHREVAQFEKLQGWIKELGGCPRHRALIVSGFLNAENVDAGLIAATAPNFESVELIRMWYEPREPWPVPCNEMFQRAARHVYDTIKAPFFWCETDCIPLKSGWLDRLEAEYHRAGKPFMGSIVNAPFRHLTGNAIYPWNIQDISTRILLAHEVAWDVIDCGVVLPLAHHTDLYFHWWSHQTGKAEAYSPEGTEFDSLDKMALIPPQAVILHRDKTGSVIDRLRERRKLILEWPRPSPGPKARRGKPMQTRYGGKKKSKFVAKEPRISNAIEPMKSSYKTCIFIRSYSKDFDWLQYCLKSLDKFANGFEEIVICVPEKDRSEIAKFNLTKERVVFSEDMSDGYLSQQYDKLISDTTTGCDYILHVDSDCVFTTPFMPENQFIDGKPWLMITPYSKFQPGDVPWKSITEKAMGETVDYEFMRRFPMLFPRWLYADVRAHIQKVHGIDLKTYIQNQPFREFSEFNLLGAVLWKYHRDKIHWIDTEITTPYTEAPNTDKPMWPRTYMKQFWSYSGVIPEARREMEAILA